MSDGSIALRVDCSDVDLTRFERDVHDLEHCPPSSPVVRQQKARILAAILSDVKSEQEKNNQFAKIDKLIVRLENVQKKAVDETKQFFTWLQKMHQEQKDQILTWNQKSSQDQIQEIKKNLSELNAITDPEQVEVQASGLWDLCQLTYLQHPENKQQLVALAYRVQQLMPSRAPTP